MGGGHTPPPRHLAELGHRRIGLVGAPTRNVDGPARLAGARDALRAAGIGDGEIHVAADDAGVAGGQRAAAEILARDLAVTGLVAYNDLMAIGAMRAVRASGRRVPDDVSVTGFDDVDLAAFVDPPLTTIAQSTAEMGRWAVDQLIRTLNRSTVGAEPHANAGLAGPSGAEPSALRGAEPAAHVVLPVRLVVRGSTGPAPRG
jgi:DNA-binding LacI/PurR family transcriptional regulator